MGEVITDNKEAPAIETVDAVGKITVFEVMAQDIDPADIGVSRSNQSTQRPADYDDQ
jgi:hypothetical protein